MPKLEKPIEQKFREAVQALGCQAIKFEDPARRGSTDRLVLIPGGIAAFIEFKRPGETPKDHQFRRMQRLRDMGFHVGWADNCEDAVLWIQNLMRTQ